MKSLLAIVLLLLTLAPVHAAVNLAVSQQSGAAVQERANQLARQLGSELGTTVTVVVLSDAAQVEDWLNRYALAEMALIDPGFVAGKPGQFVVIGPVGPDLTLIGRRGIAGDLPQRLAALLAKGGSRSAAAPAAVVASPPAAKPPVALAQADPVSFSASKSVEEDRSFVRYVYREKFDLEPSAEQLDYWTQQLQSGALEKQQFFDKICRKGLALCSNEY